MNFSTETCQSAEDPISGYPSILVPQLISSNNTDIVMDNDSKGWVVSLDYGTTAVIALVSGQFQASRDVQVSGVWTGEDQSVK